MTAGKLVPELVAVRIAQTRVQLAPVDRAEGHGLSLIVMRLNFWTIFFRSSFLPFFFILIFSFKSHSIVPTIIMGSRFHRDKMYSDAEHIILQLPFTRVVKLNDSVMTLTSGQDTEKKGFLQETISMSLFILLHSKYFQMHRFDNDNSFHINV
jgi:hypothetical protein